MTETLPTNDLYLRSTVLQNDLKLLELQSEYVRDELRNLRIELERSKSEVQRVRSVPLVLGSFLEGIDAGWGIVGSTTGSQYVVSYIKTDSGSAIIRISHCNLFTIGSYFVDTGPRIAKAKR